MLQNQYTHSSHTHFKIEHTTAKNTHAENANLKSNITHTSACKNLQSSNKIVCTQIEFSFISNNQNNKFTHQDYDGNQHNKNSKSSLNTPKYYERHESWNDSQPEFSDAITKLLYHGLSALYVSSVICELREQPSGELAYALSENLSAELQQIILCRGWCSQKLNSNHIIS